MNVLYEDNHLLVVEKPYGVPSQADSSGDKDMHSIAKAYVKEKYNKPGDVYLGLVHRLDRPTRGVMVFARTSKAAARLTKQIQSGEFQKTYFAVLTAAPAQKENTLTHYILKDEKNRMARVFDAPRDGARKATLRYETLEKRDGLCLVRVYLQTGRFHQIRAQFAHIGCAVYGDMKYGNQRIKEKLALFASEVRLTHPTKKEPMRFSLSPAHHPFSMFEIQ